MLDMRSFTMTKGLTKGEWHQLNFSVWVKPEDGTILWYGVTGSGRLTEWLMGLAFRLLRGVSFRQTLNRRG